MVLPTALPSPVALPNRHTGSTDASWSFMLLGGVSLSGNEYVRFTAGQESSGLQRTSLIAEAFDCSGAGATSTGYARSPYLHQDSTMNGFDVTPLDSERAVVVVNSNSTLWANVVSVVGGTVTWGSWVRIAGWSNAGYEDGWVWAASGDTPSDLSNPRAGVSAKHYDLSLDGFVSIATLSGGDVLVFTPLVEWTQPSPPAMVTYFALAVKRLSVTGTTVSSATQWKLVGDITTREGSGNFRQTNRACPIGTNRILVADTQGAGYLYEMHGIVVDSDLTVIGQSTVTTVDNLYGAVMAPRSDGSVGALVGGNPTSTMRWTSDATFGAVTEQSTAPYLQGSWYFWDVSHRGPAGPGDTVVHWGWDDVGVYVISYDASSAPMVEGPVAIDYVLDDLGSLVIAHLAGGSRTAVEIINGSGDASSLAILEWVTSTPVLTATVGRSRVRWFA